MRGGEKKDEIRLMIKKKRVKKGKKTGIEKRERKTGKQNQGKEVSLCAQRSEIPRQLP